MYITKKRYPDAKDIVGIAINALSDGSSSEDVVYLDARIWTDEDILRAEDAENWLKNLGMLGRRKMHTTIINEYPEGENKFSRALKGRDRNKPCPCGSEKKYKKCCGAWTTP